MIEHEYTALFPFGGSGGGAHGFSLSEARLFGHRARFRNIGGFDISPTACQSFHYLTGTPELCIDVRTLTVEDIWRYFGRTAPDVVFPSAPCKGSSKLISNEKAEDPHYEALNELSLVWTRLMLEAWQPGPRLFLFENVPNITVRAKKMLEELRRMMRRAGYLIDDRAHELGEMAPLCGHYDAGELGGLAQRRKRWLLVGRLPTRCAPFLYQPPKQRVRGIGEVIGPLPLPEDPEGGPMHLLPRISVMNWIRLALIPAGGDWRDLPGVLEEHQERRAVYRRMHLAAWEAPSVTVGGGGTNGPYGVADPRMHFGNVDRVTAWNGALQTVTHAPAPSSGGGAIADPRLGFTPYDGAYGVLDWSAPSRTVTARGCYDNACVSVADPRIAAAPDTCVVLPCFSSASTHHNLYRVTGWESATGTITGAGRPGQGGASVADPRIAFAPDTCPRGWHNGALGVGAWEAPASTITGNGRPTAGRFAVADPRPARRWYPGVLGVVPWNKASGTVTGESLPANGAFSTADPRVSRAFDRGYSVIPWDKPSNTVAGVSQVGCGTYSVADPRGPLRDVPGVLTLDEALNLLEGPGPWAIVDPSSDGAPLAIIKDLRKPPPFPLVIIAADGTWHRPLTPLEKAIVQGLPAKVNGKPLELAGSGSTDWNEQIGNLVPSPAASAIGDQMLYAMLSGDLGAFSLSSEGDVWVAPEDCAPVH